MKAVVQEIQVCGGPLCKNLGTVCATYLNVVAEGTDREKIRFSILLPNGEHKSITIRQEQDGVVAYGDFEGLPSFLDYAKEV